VIVRQTSDALQLITQPDHARLAGAIMQHDAALAEHPRRSSILLAIAEHDNGWVEPDAEPLVDPVTGLPLDFISAPIAVRQGVWPRGIARLAHDPWASALVAQHAIVIFDRYRGDPAWTQFFAEIETMRGERLEASGLPLRDLLSDYPFVGLGDLISLTFCNGWTEVQRFDTWSVRLSGSQVLVWPDLFEGNTISIAIEAREIRQRAFRSDAELRGAFATAFTTTVKGVTVGAPSPF
jgi:Protein of unknown function (DUF3891)